MTIQRLTANFTSSVRFEYLEGREYLVAPMVMITEGVHNGTNGPIYYPPEELSHPAAVASWNHKPIVVYHPTDTTLSACDVGVIENQKVGMILNTYWDDTSKRLKAEAWLEIPRLEKVDSRILQNLESGNIMEVSTGVFSENEEISGVWNNESYVKIARQLRADHLALLPDLVGACSVQDGAGLLQMNCRQVITKLKKNGIICNEGMAFSDIRFRLSTALREKFGSSTWIEEVYSDHVVFERTDLDKLLSLGYTSSNDKVVLSSDDPQQVARKTEFVPITNSKGTDMKKEEIVNGLIANKATKWTEGDRKFLLTINEDELVKFQPEEVEVPEVKIEEKLEEKPEEKKTENSSNTNQPVTLNEYIEQAPAEIREMLQEGLMTRNEQKKKLVEKILNAEGNRFTKDQLEKRPLGDLQAIADLVPTKNEGKDYPGFNYSGAAGSHVQNSDEEIEPLLVPVMNWSE